MFDRRERSIFGRGEPPDSFNRLIKQIEQFREAGGEGGCFAEVLGGIEGKASLALIFHQRGFIDPSGIDRVFGELSSLVNGLPSLQTPEAFKEAQLKLEEITLY